MKHVGHLAIAAGMTLAVIYLFNRFSGRNVSTFGAPHYATVGPNLPNE